VCCQVVISATGLSRVQEESYLVWSVRVWSRNFVQVA
jgi:hypothetical protein